MNRFLKSALTLFLAGTMLIPTLTACDKSTPDSTTAAVTTTEEAVTTTAAPEAQVPAPAELLSANVYAAAGIESAENLIKRYYNKRTHSIMRSFTESHDSEIWYVAAFLDALSEAYRLYPDNATVKETYVDCLDNCLPKYRVTANTFKSPAGTFRKITYYNAGAGGSGDFYFDDNAWICICYLTAYDLLGTEEYLTRAEEILEFLWTGYDDYQGGGIYWSKSWSDGGKSNKGVCTNAPSAISYLWTYQITGNKTYLERGKLLYNWVLENIECNNGVYHAGVNDPWQPAYDQGTMMYATVLLYEIEGDDAYLKRARTSYNGTVSHMFNITGSRNDQKVTMKENPIFKSWCIGWLVRGMCKYYTVDSKQSTVFMRCMEYVLNDTLQTKDKNGQYDPFFCAPNNGWWKEKNFDNQVIQPAGVTSVLLLAANFYVNQRGSNESLK